MVSQHLSKQTVPTASGAMSPPIGIVGVSGYAGGELARILLRHPRLSPQELHFFGRSDEARTETSRSLSEIHPQLAHAEEVRVHAFRWSDVEQSGIRVLLLATPHEYSRTWVPEALARGIRVIDLSGAWRLKDDRNREVYRFNDAQSNLARDVQAESVYGSPELHKDAIARANLVANPGCYATSVILALSSLLREGLVDVDHGIICDAKSGVSGAGKNPSPGTHFMYAADNLSAYSVFGHRHTGEFLEQLHLSAAQIQFTPHLLPIPRGILSTIYLRLTEPLDADAVVQTMRTFYQDCPFVRIRKGGALPQIQHVIHTNFCDIGVAVDQERRRAVVVSCLDNLIKGAAGQAIQNMNIMLGWEETEGLL